MSIADITCTLFNGVRPGAKDVWRGTWEAFVSECLPVLVAKQFRAPADDSEKAWSEAKKRQHGYVLAAVEGKRHDDNVRDHTALAIDVDALPGNDLAAFLKRCARYTCAVYETASSTDEEPRVRVIAALDAPLAPEHVPAARRALAERLGLDPDVCGTAGALPASQVMFAGCLRGTRERGVWTYAGKRVYAPPRVTVAAPEPKRKRRESAAPREDNAVLRRNSPAIAAAPGAFDFDAPPDLSALCKYVPPAGLDGDRHLLVRGLGGWLARRGYAPEAIAEAVRLQIPSSDPAERAAQAQDAADRARAELDAPGWEALSSWAERFAKGPRTLTRLEKACRDPREPIGFDGVWSEWWARYLPAFVERCEARQAERRRAATVEAAGLAEGEPPAEAQDGTGLHLHPATGWPWILQRDGSYWIHRVSERTYRNECRSSELEASVARNLAGLVSEEERQPKELRASWIKPLEHLRSAYTIRAHTYEVPTNALTLAALRWTTRTATYHAHIDRWLRALFGKGYDAAAQWIASLSDLDRPAPCLYLPGPRGLGKSLLADGLAALWSRPAPVDMAEAISDFNEATAECPLVFTDEGFPEGLDFGAFRKMITAHSRRVNPKHKAKVDVEGCGRHMIAANNEDVLRYQKIGTLTADDLDAIADRLLVVPCDVSARELVDNLDTDAAARYEIAEHALYLASTVKLEPKGRMAAKPGGGERILASVVAGRSSEILNRIRECLGSGSMGEKSGIRARREGEVWVNVQRLSETFDGRVTVAAVKECCESFALRPGAEQHKSADGDNLRWRILSRERLVAAFATLD